MANTKVTTGVIKDDAVGADQLASNSVVTASIVDNAVLTAKIQDQNVTTAKIANASVTVSKMAPNSVDSDQYVDGSIDTAHIADSQITSAKLDTNIAVGGTLTLGSHLIMGDGDILKMGASADLQIYHDGDHSRIVDAGTGNLSLQGNDFRLKNSDASATYMEAANGGSVSLFYAGSKKFETASGGVTVTGTLTADDLEIDSGTLSVDASNNRVGIGTTSPARKLVVENDASTSDNSSISIISGNAGFAQLLLGDSDADVRGYLAYQNSDDSLQIGGNGTERMRITSAGAVEIKGSSTTTNAQAFITNDNSVLTIGSSVSGSVVKDISFNSPSAMMYIDGSSGCVGIGTSSPSSYDSRSNNLVVGDSGDAGITIFSGATSNARLQFAPSGSTGLDNGLIDYDNNDDSMAFATGGTERMRIASNGYLIAQSASQVRLVLGSTGNSSNNTSNWIRGTGNELGLNSGGGNIGIEINGSAKATINTAGQILLNSLGTTTPTFAFINDPNTGMSRPTTDTLNFCTAGAERMRINHQGNISFGTQSVSPSISQFFNAISGNYGGHFMTQNNSVPVTSIGNNFFINNSTQNQRVLARAAQNFQLDHLGNFRFQSVASGSAGETNFTFTEHMILDINGRLGIGDMVPSFKLEVASNAGTDGTVCGLKDIGNHGSNRDYIRFFNSSSAIAGRIEHTSSTGVTYVTSSDYRMKENIRPLENGLSRVQQLKPVKFDWIENKESCEGFIAHEVDEVFTEAVAGKKDAEEMQGVDYGRITPLLVKAIQEQQAQIDIQNTLITNLTARIETLEG